MGIKEFEHYVDPWLTVYHGDCKTVMAAMPAESVHMVCTSPPYWGLRDYGAPGQLGLEPTPEEYVANLVAVFREVKRVLRRDGTVWLNLGDSYTGSGKGGNPDEGKQATNKGSQSIGVLYGKTGETARKAALTNVSRRWTAENGMAPKNLVGIPWRVAFALQADGWYLRSDIIWAKPNPMPESVTDRPTKSHEYLFLLSRSPRYYFDADAVRDEPQSYSRKGGTASWTADSGHSNGVGSSTFHQMSSAGRNLRSVWTIATAPYPGAHFATFPPKLVEPCIKAGTSEKGVCPECGAPWERVVERPIEPEGLRNRGNGAKLDYHTRQTGSGQKLQDWMDANPKATTGWKPSCRHGYLVPLAPVPSVVLDPFAGSGTTGMVAQSLSRRAILIDLSLDYLGQLMERNARIPLGMSL